MRTKIFTDTTCDLSPERRAAHDITALPLHVFLGETDYLDGVDVTPQQLFDYAGWALHHLAGGDQIRQMGR